MAHSLGGRPVSAQPVFHVPSDVFLYSNLVLPSVSLSPSNRAVTVIRLSLSTTAGLLKTTGSLCGNHRMLFPLSTELAGLMGLWLAPEGRASPSLTSTYDMSLVAPPIIFMPHIAGELEERSRKRFPAAPLSVTVPVIVWVFPASNVRVPALATVFVRLTNVVAPDIDWSPPVRVTVLLL